MINSLIVMFVAWLVHLVSQKKDKLTAHWTMGPVTEQRLDIGPIEARMQQLTDTQQVSLSVSFTDKKGAPAPVQNPVWSSSDASVAKVVVDATDPLKALVVAGLPGTAQVSMTADSDLGDGVAPIIATLDVVVTGGSAVNVKLSTGTPVEQPAA